MKGHTDRKDEHETGAVVGLRAGSGRITANSEVSETSHARTTTQSQTFCPSLLQIVFRPRRTMLEGRKEWRQLTERAATWEKLRPEG